MAFEEWRQKEVVVLGGRRAVQTTGLGREYRPPFCGALSLSAKIGTVRRLRAHEMRAVKAQGVSCLEF